MLNNNKNLEKNNKFEQKVKVLVQVKLNYQDFQKLKKKKLNNKKK